MHDLRRLCMRSKALSLTLPLFLRGAASLSESTTRLSLCDPHKFCSLVRHNSATISVHDRFVSRKQLLQFRLICDSLSVRSSGMIKGSLCLKAFAAKVLYSSATLSLSVWSSCTINSSLADDWFLFVYDRLLTRVLSTSHLLIVSSLVFGYSIRTAFKTEGSL